MPRRIADQLRRNLSFNAWKLVVHRGNADAQGLRRVLIGRMDAGRDPQDHLAHQPHDRREQQLPRVSSLGGLLIQSIQPARIKGSFQDSTNHHTDWTLFHKGIKSFPKHCSVASQNHNPLPSYRKRQFTINPRPTTAQYHLERGGWGLPRPWRRSLAVGQLVSVAQELGGSWRREPNSTILLTPGIRSFGPYLQDSNEASQRFPSTVGLRFFFVFRAIEWCDGAVELGRPYGLARPHYCRSANTRGQADHQGTRISVEFVIDLLARGSDDRADPHGVRSPNVGGYPRLPGLRRRTGQRGKGLLPSGIVVMHIIANENVRETSDDLSSHHRHTDKSFIVRPPQRVHSSSVRPVQAGRSLGLSPHQQLTIRVSPVPDVIDDDLAAGLVDCIDDPICLTCIPDSSSLLLLAPVWRDPRGRGLSCRASTCLKTRTTTDCGRDRRSFSPMV